METCVENITTSNITNINNINNINNIKNSFILKTNIIDSLNSDNDNDNDNDNNLDSNELMKLCKTIESLEKIHHIEIAKILKINNVYLNENNNGIFVNLNKITTNVHKQIYNYIEFVKKQESDINKDEKLKKNLETIYFKDNKDIVSNNSNKIQI